MIIEERVTKDGGTISRRLNELGLRIGEFSIIDWNPMFVIILYQSKVDPLGTPDTERRIKDLETEQRMLKTLKDPNAAHVQR